MTSKNLHYAALALVSAAGWACSSTDTAGSAVDASVTGGTAGSQRHRRQWRRRLTQ